MLDMPVGSVHEVGSADAKVLSIMMLFSCMAVKLREWDGVNRPDALSDVAICWLPDLPLRFILMVPKMQNITNKAPSSPNK